MDDNQYANPDMIVAYKSLSPEERRDAKLVTIKTKADTPTSPTTTKATGKVKTADDLLKKWGF